MNKLSDLTVVMHSVPPKGEPRDVMEARLSEELDLCVPRWPPLHDAMPKLDDGVVCVATDNPQLVLRPLPYLWLAGVHHARPGHQ